MFALWALYHCELPRPFHSCVVCCYPCDVNPGFTSSYEIRVGIIRASRWRHGIILHVSHCCSCNPFDCPLSRPRPHTLLWPCFSSPSSTISLALLSATTTHHDEQDRPYPPCRRGRQSWVHLLPGPDHRGRRVRHRYGLQITFSPWL